VSALGGKPIVTSLAAAKVNVSRDRRPGDIHAVDKIVYIA
jgi:hypothetical protein